MAPVPTEPVHLIEDAATGDRFLIYGTEKGLRVELRYALLDNQLRSLSRQVLRGGGSVKTAQAKAHAQEQYRVFNEKRKAVRFAEADAALTALRAQEKILPKSPRK